MSETLLLIEDEPLLSAELQRHFQRGGWEVAVAGTIANARSLLLEADLQPLVVVSDMSLPDGNALDLLESVRARVPNGEWLFLTGYGGVADSVRALRSGAFDFLEKPCDLERLDLVVSGAARSARAQRQLRERPPWRTGALRRMHSSARAMRPELCARCSRGSRTPRSALYSSPEKPGPAKASPHASCITPACGAKGR